MSDIWYIIRHEPDWNSDYGDLIDDPMLDDYGWFPTEEEAERFANDVTYTWLQRDRIEFEADEKLRETQLRELNDQIAKIKADNRALEEAGLSRLKKPEPEYQRYGKRKWNETEARRRMNVTYTVHSASRYDK